MSGGVVLVRHPLFFHNLLLRLRGLRAPAVDHPDLAVLCHPQVIRQQQVPGSKKIKFTGSQESGASSFGETATVPDEAESQRNSSFIPLARNQESCQTRQTSL